MRKYKQRAEQFAKVPTLACPYQNIAFSEAIVEVYNLRSSKPTGWEQKRLTLLNRVRGIHDKIASGEIEVSCWSKEYSVAERKAEIESLREEYMIYESLDELFEIYVDNQNTDDILLDIENTIGELL